MRQVQFLYLFYTERNHDIGIKELVMYKDQSYSKMLTKSRIKWKQSNSRIHDFNHVNIASKKLLSPNQ